MVGICKAPTDWDMANIAEEFIKEVSGVIDGRMHALYAIPRWLVEDVIRIGLIAYPIAE